MAGPSAPSWRAVLGDLMAGRSLDADTTAWAMNEIMSGEATAAQLAAFAVLLRAKRETPDELAGLVRTMLGRAPAVPVSGRAVDIVGTGGDGAQTVNISTMAALVVAGTGRRVIKHGNRAASSACGAADVLERLGIAIDLPAAGVAATVEKVGIGFCFAPVFHAGMRFAGAPRRELGVPTVFNFLGPLTNPGRPGAAAVGCADPGMAPVLAEVFARRGDSALVVRGDDGLDELTTTTTSRVWVASDGQVRTAIVDPTRFGIPPARPADLRGGDPEHNAAVVRDVLAGGGGGARDAVLVNAAAAVAAHDDILTGTDRLEDALAAGLDAAREAVDSGAAAEVLHRWIAVSQEAADSGVAR